VRKKEGVIRSLAKKKGRKSGRLKSGEWAENGKKRSSKGYSEGKHGADPEET